MNDDILSAALLQSMSRDLSVADLLKTIDTLRGSGQAASVETVYATWIQHNQDHPLLYAILFNYSVILTDTGRLQEAREALERAVKAKPDFMPAYINLGRVYERLGNANLAIIQWAAGLSRLTAIDGPAITYKTTALNQSARALEAANQDESAEEMLRQSLDIDSHQREVVQHLIALRQRQCKWPVVTPCERVSRDVLMHGMSPLSAAAYSDDPMLHLAVAGNYNLRDVGTPEQVMDQWPAASLADGPLRIGYLCSDLREHALGYLMTEVFALHKREKVEVFAYYCGPEAQDPLHKQFQATADRWVSITGMDDAAAARRMAEDKIQILVDLNGYTREARVKLIALRPAPIIVNWLGFPGTMASPYHHYIIADDWIIPAESEKYYTEKVLRLPCYQPSSRKRSVATKRPTRAEAGLPEQGFVYCCFNGAHKITQFTFDRWLLILSQVPGSVLWLLSSIESAHQRLKAHAAQRGIDPEHIIFAPKLANPFHLIRYPLADLCLDTTPYGAHTTASDALWMGVPVMTLSGRSFAARVCGSLVRAAGMPEMAFTSAEEFVDRAVEFGRDPASLKPIRDRLLAEREASTLFNMPLLVGRLEELYAEMWQDFKNGALPRPDLANLDVYLDVGSQLKHEEIEVQTVKDYEGLWREKLIARNKARTIPPDHRLADCL